MSDNEEGSNASGDNEEGGGEEGSDNGSGEGEGEEGSDNGSGEGEGEEGSEKGSGDGEEGEEDEGSGEGEEGEGEDGEGSGDDKPVTKKKKTDIKSPLIQSNEVKIDITPYPINEDPLALSGARPKTTLELLQDINKDLNEMFNELKSTITNFGREKQFNYNTNYQYGNYKIIKYSNVITYLYILLI